MQVASFCIYIFLYIKDQGFNNGQLSPRACIVIATSCI